LNTIARIAVDNRRVTFIQLHSTIILYVIVNPVGTCVDLYFLVSYSQFYVLKIDYLISKIYFNLALFQPDYECYMSQYNDKYNY